MTLPACWQCGAPLDGLPLPLGRSAECPRCRVALRVCRGCAFFDPLASSQCRENQAEPVPEKERPNFCDYFRPGAGGSTQSGAAGQARAGLDALFGGGSGAARPGGEEAARQALDKLFGKKS